MPRFRFALNEVVGFDVQKDPGGQSCDVIFVRTSDGDTHEIALWPVRPAAQASPAGPLVTNHNPGQPPPLRTA